MLMFISNNILSTVWKYLAWKQGKYFITCISSWDSRSSTRHFPWEKKERKYFRKAPPPTGSKQKHALYFSSTLSSWEKNRQTIRDYKLLFYILNIAEQKNKNRRQMLHSRSSDRLHGGFGASPSDLPGQTTVATARRRPAEWLLGTVCVLTQGSRALAGGFAGANDPISDRIFFTNF